MLSATLNNISVISWRSVLLVEKAGENHLPAASHRQIYHIMLCQVHPTWVGFELTTLVVIGTDCICSSKSNYPTIMTTTASVRIWFVVWKFQWFREKEGYYCCTLIDMIKSLYFDNSLLKTHVAIDNFVSKADRTII